MSWNFQPGVHPDADQLSVFVEGAATAREQEEMLAHLSECAVCRKAVFLMQPHEELQTVTATPEKGWMWRWLVPVGLPAAALACGLILLVVYLRPHGGVPRAPQQIASVRPPETERHGTTPAPGSNLEQSVPTNADRATNTNTEQVARSEKPTNSSARKTTAANLSRQKNAIASSSSLPASDSRHAVGGAIPQTTVGGPITSAQTEDSTLAQSTISSATISNLPVQSRNVMDLQQLSPPADTKGAAPQNGLAKKKELPALEIGRAGEKEETLAGISGYITDPSGAVISGVTVTLRDATGKTRQTITGVDGSFNLTDLPAGQYELTATARGFKTSQQSIELKPSELAMLQPRLNLGATSEQVTVEAASSTLETESATLGRQVTAELPSTRRVIPLPSLLPSVATVSHGKRSLSLDDAGNLFLSRNEGKKWKKIRPRWAGKIVRIDLTPAYRNEAPPKAENEAGPASKGAVFQLTTDSGVVWTSKDGAHWHQQ